MRSPWRLLPIVTLVVFSLSSPDVSSRSISGKGEGLVKSVHPTPVPSGDDDTPQRSVSHQFNSNLQGSIFYSGDNIAVVH